MREVLRENKWRISSRVLAFALVVLLGLTIHLAYHTFKSDAIDGSEAIEISERVSELVREGRANAYASSASGVFYNSSMVKQLKQGHNQEIYEKIPEGHSAWEIVWNINLGVGGYLITVIIDAETGTIVQDVLGVGYD